MVDPEVMKFITNSRGPHRGLVIDIVDCPGVLVLRMYRDNINSMPKSLKEEMALWVMSLVKKINDMGTLCRFEVVK